MRKLLGACCAIMLAGSLGMPSARAINVFIDYTYDLPANGGSNFFSAGNPDGAISGARARLALEAAADYFSEILTDTLDAIVTPPPFESSTFGGVYTWEWTASFAHPSTATDITFTNPTVPANEYRIYVGARNIPGTTLGSAGPGGWGYSAGGNGGFYTSAEIAQIDVITEEFFELVETRGEPDDEFALWGGTATFDTDADWHYDHTAPVPAGTNDFYSVAIHELAHALGFGTSQEWTALANQGTFFGAEARAANSDVYPGVNGGHWSNGLMSTVYGGTQSQETALDSDLTTGSRKEFTLLDAAALADIGWEITPPQLTLPGDYNGDNIVNAADYTIWRNSLGTGNVIGSYAGWRTNYGRTAGAGAVGVVPEPSSLALLALVLVGVASERRRRAL